MIDCFKEVTRCSKEVFKVFKVFPEDSKKLQDVQQEREGTSLNYFKVIFNYIKQFSWSIALSCSTVSVYLSLFWTILVYLCATWSNLVYLGLSRTIWDYLAISGTIWNYLALSGTIYDYLGLSNTIWQYIGLSGTI